MAADDRPPRFDDGKDADAMRTIGEIAAAFGIRQHVLRYWEQQFPMLRPLKRSGGRRHYRPEDVAMIETIDRLINREGYTLKGARQAIERGTQAKSARPEPVGSEAGAEPQRQSFSAPAPTVLPQLRAIRDRLAAALAA